MVKVNAFDMPELLPYARINAAGEGVDREQSGQPPHHRYRRSGRPKVSGVVAGGSGGSTAGLSRVAARCWFVLVRLNLGCVGCAGMLGGAPVAAGLICRKR
jgi:hypothetical protein